MANITRDVGKKWQVRLKSRRVLRENSIVQLEQDRAAAGQMYAVANCNQRIYFPEMYDAENSADRCRATSRIYYVSVDPHSKQNCAAAE